MLLETDTDDPLTEREAARRAWTTRTRDLGVDDALLPEERALLDRAVAGLTEDELDDLHGRVTGGLVLLWAIGRIDTRPSFASVDALEATLSECGLLGDGSISRAKAAAEAARLRDPVELEAALTAYAQRRGLARDTEDPEKIFAGIATHHLEWVVDSDMTFET